MGYCSVFTCDFGMMLLSLQEVEKKFKELSALINFELHPLLIVTGERGSLGQFQPLHCLKHRNIYLQLNYAAAKF